MSSRIKGNSSGSGGTISGGVRDSDSEDDVEYVQSNGSGESVESDTERNDKKKKKRNSNGENDGHGQEAQSSGRFEMSCVSEFFSLVSETEKDYTVTCHLCKPQGKQLKTAKNTWSNLKKHVQVRDCVCARITWSTTLPFCEQ